MPQRLPISPKWLTKLRTRGERAGMAKVYLQFSGITENWRNGPVGDWGVRASTSPDFIRATGNSWRGWNPGWALVASGACPKHREPVVGRRPAGTRAKPGAIEQVSERLDRVLA